MKKTTFALLLTGLIASTSCVTLKTHKELQGRYDSLQDEHNQVSAKAASLEVDLRETQARLEKMRQEMAKLQEDSTARGNDLRRLQKNYDDLNRSYEFLLKNNNTLLAQNARENKALLERLEDLQDKLQTQEDSLSHERKQLELLSAQLQAREKRVNELESAIARKDSAMASIRKKVSDALMGFQGKGLTVEMKNGRVYVSMENSLLFPSGSFTVTQRGESALTELAQVLSENKDINVMIEGHTDADAYRGSGQVSDNWDLSVMRATSVTKILLKNKKIDPVRITAAGRGEHLPLASNDSAENKAINRRTEIILTPKIEELLNILE